MDILKKYRFTEKLFSLKQTFSPSLTTALRKKKLFNIYNASFQQQKYKMVASKSILLMRNEKFS